MGNSLRREIETDTQIVDLTKSVNRLCEILEHKESEESNKPKDSSKVLFQAEAMKLPLSKGSSVSDPKIDEYVENLLKEGNLNELPEFLERRAFKPVIKALLLSLCKTSETSNVNLFGHRLRIVLEPIESKEQISVQLQSVKEAVSESSQE